VSFQGDVAGIGLGELLQGLARGGREGVLTLRGGALGATVGLAGGQIHLLPEPDEDPEIWRKRCERAWVRDPNQRIDMLRMREIAFAARLEQMFELLDCQGVHFRFDQGPLPGAGISLDDSAEKPLGRVETGTKLDVRVPVLCQPISVEYLLLEYARLSDECAGHGDANQMPLHVVPRLIVQDSPTSELERLWGECDGVSNVMEIADRMGWPLRQAKATLVDLMVKGYARPSDSRELLVLAQREIADNRFARAASRLSGWCLVAQPGPPAAGDVELFLEEWAHGKLPVVLASMEPPLARTLLRRIDLVDRDVPAAIQRWQELFKYHRHDSQTELRLIAWRLKSTEESDAPQMADLLKLARKFQDLGWNMRAGVVLRAAAARLPETTSVRLEVGQRLLAVGHVEEGIHWVLEACRTLIDSDLSEKALNPLHNVLEVEPTNREARALMSLARTKAAHGQKTRRNSIMALATLLVVSGGALVKVRFDMVYDRRLSAVSELMDRPQAALDLLETSFANDHSSRVTNLRETLLARVTAENRTLKEAWMERYKAAQLECTIGDERMGLRLALDVPLPPEIKGEEDNWPTVRQLLESLVARLEQSFAQFPTLEDEATVLASQDSLNSERRFEGLVTELDKAAAKAERSFAVETFHKRILTLRESIDLRNESRTTARQKLEGELQDQELDRLLSVARVHKLAGDIERAVDYYRKLFDSPGSEKIRGVLQPEKDQAEQHLGAYKNAVALAEEGRHAEAEKALAEGCENVREHFLPWRVESQPSGARTRLGDGSVRTTPFTMQSSIGEPIQLTFEQEGYERVLVSVDRPTDVLARLSKLPDRWWKTASRVSALPIPVGDEHIVANRAGEIARLSAKGSAVWQHRLASLGGIARTPVLLANLKGTLLVLTEDGIAWLVEADGGRVEGPWKFESPPVQGPTPTARGIEATFADGRTAIWTNKLAPQVIEPAEAAAGEGTPRVEEAAAREPRADAKRGMAVLRRQADGPTRLEPAWGAWSVEVTGAHYLVRHSGDSERDYAIEARGEWAYLAWEPPDARLPNGRLWVSDDGGLRAWEPR
jgi:tetratricopeptide (TPR) repeat protein